MAVRSSSLAGSAWLFAVVVLAALFAVVGARGELREVFALIGTVTPASLAVVGLLQAGTYVAAGGVWELALAHARYPQRLRLLVLLAFAMLFSNQAVPTVGLSGGLVVVRALDRRGVPERAAMTALLVGLVTTYTAFLLAIAGGIVLVRQRPYALAIAVTAGAIFSLLAASVVFGTFELRHLRPSWQKRLERLPVIGEAIAQLVVAPMSLDRIGRTLILGTGVQLVEIVLDAATFWVCLHAVGAGIRPSAAFSSYVIASVASRVAFAPLGLGTFESAAVTLLHLAGARLEPALAGTLLFRGFTLWLPMLPGLWCTRWALRGALRSA